MTHGCIVRKVRFARDSPLEGDGFEPSVPRQIRCRFHDGSPVSHEGLTVTRPGTISSNSSPSSSESCANPIPQCLRRVSGTLPLLRGTDGSNPSPSSGESDTNL